MLTRLLVAAGIAIASGAARADYVPNAVTQSLWTLGGSDGGLDGGAVYLNSAGADPFKSGSWTLFNGATDDIQFSANLGPAGTFSNEPISSAVSLLGVPDPTSGGEWFVAPANAKLSEFDFTIANASAGTNATFVLATWSQSAQALLTLLYAGTSYVNNDHDPDTNVNIVPDIPLTAGQAYIAFLTVSAAVQPTGGGLSASPVPETSTWVMMALGFAGLSIAGRQLTRKASPIPA